MKLAQAVSVAIALLLITATPVSAGTKDRHTEPAVEREVRHLAFDSPEAAERFFDALNFVLEARGKRPRLDVTLREDTVEIAGPPKLMGHVAALIGSPDQPRPGDQPRRAKARRRGRDQGQASDLVAQLLAALDDSPAHGRSKRDRAHRHQREPELVVRVFELEFADAPHLVRFVDMLRVGSKAPWAVECDERTNSIVVKGPSELIAKAEQLIQQLDQPVRNSAGEPAMKLMPLSHADARKLCEVVARAGRWSMMDLVAVPDRRTNTIVLAGPKQQIREASALIQKLDVKVKAAPKIKAKPGPAPDKRPAKKPKQIGKKVKKKAKQKQGPNKPVSKKAPPAEKPSPSLAETDV